VTYVPRNLTIFLLEAAWKYPDAPAACGSVFYQFHGFGRLKVFYVGSRSLIPYPVCLGKQCVCVCVCGCVQVREVGKRHGGIEGMEETDRETIEAERKQNTVKGEAMTREEERK
jgi:hypothetical protein